MAYKSPLHIIPKEELASGKGLGKEDLQRLKKKLLLEFNLTQSPTIQVNGVAFSKDELIKQFDVLLDSNDLTLHQFIYADPKLLGFLENETSGFPPVYYNRLEIPAECVDAFWDLYGQRFKDQLKKVLLKRDFASARNAIRDVKEMPADVQNSMYESIYFYNDEYIAQITEQKNSVPDVRMEELKFLRTKDFIIYLNGLPESFAAQRDEVVVSVINLVSDYYNVRKKADDFSYYVQHNLIDVTCNDDLKKLIESNDRIISNSYFNRNVTKTSKNSSGGYGAISTVFFAIVMCIRVLVTCNHQGSSSSYNFDTVKMLQSEMDKIHSDSSQMRLFERCQAKHDEDTSRYQDKRTITDLEFFSPDTLKNGVNPFPPGVLHGEQGYYEQSGDSNSRVVRFKNGFSKPMILFLSKNNKILTCAILPDSTVDLNTGDQSELKCYTGKKWRSYNKAYTLNESTSLSLASLNLMNYFQDRDSSDIVLSWMKYGIAFKSKAMKKLKDKTPVVVLKKDMVKDKSNQKYITLAAAYEIEGKP